MPHAYVELRSDQRHIVRIPGRCRTGGGTLRWCSHSTAGVEFDEPLTPQMVGKLAKLYPARESGR